jgi:hypothetical protein
MGSYVVEKNTRARRRLLSHCALVGRAVKRRIPARRRLERALGREQTHMLLQALSGSQGLVRRRRFRRVKSSP